MVRWRENLHSLDVLIYAYKRAYVSIVTGSDSASLSLPSLQFADPIMPLNQEETLSVFDCSLQRVMFPLQLTTFRACIIIAVHAHYVLRGDLLVAMYCTYRKWPSFFTLVHLQDFLF